MCYHIFIIYKKVKKRDKEAENKISNNKIKWAWWGSGESAWHTAGPSNWQGLLKPVLASLHSRPSHRPTAPALPLWWGSQKMKEPTFPRQAPWELKLRVSPEFQPQGRPPSQGRVCPLSLSQFSLTQKKQAGRRDQQINPPPPPQATVLPAPRPCPQAAGRRHFWAAGSRPVQLHQVGFGVLRGLICPLPLVILLVRWSPGNQVTTTSRNALWLKSSEAEHQARFTGDGKLSHRLGELNFI